jgi:hypothetical protein
MKPRKLTRRQLAAKLGKLAKEMKQVGAELEYFGGFSPVAQHGREMQGAARITLLWVMELRK